MGTVGHLPDAVADTGDELIVAGVGEVQRSTDGGRTWDVLHRYGE